MVTDCGRCSSTIASMSSPLARASVDIAERCGTTTLSSRYFATQRYANNTWRTQPVRQNALTKRFHFAHHLPPTAHTYTRTHLNPRAYLGAYGTSTRNNAANGTAAAICSWLRKRGFPPPLSTRAKQVCLQPSTKRSGRGSARERVYDVRSMTMARLCLALARLAVAWLARAACLARRSSPGRQAGRQTLGIPYPQVVKTKPKRTMAEKRLFFFSESLL